MRPILFITDANFLSHLLRCMEIAKELRSRGESVVFAASGMYEQLLDDAGFTRYPVFTNCPVHTMKATRASMFRYYNAGLLKKSVDSEIARIQETKPKVVIGDFRWTLRISTEYCNVPYVGLINTMWTPFYAPFRSISEKMLLRKLFGKKFIEWISPYGEKLMMFNRGKIFRRLRKKLGLEEVSNLMYEMYGQLSLMPDIPEFCPAVNLPDSFHYIGPLFARSDQTKSTKIFNIPNEPYIYVTLGSTATPKMIQLAFDAFRTISVPVVMTTGGQALPDSPPDNFIIYEYLPADAAYKNAMVAVCHGGQGTLYQALSYGVPVIGIATHNDQQWNLDRVTALSLGIQFGEDSCTAAEITNAFYTVTRNTSYTASCARMKDILSHYNAPVKAAELIVAYTQSGHNQSAISSTLPA